MISALQTVLQKMNPAYEWIPGQGANTGFGRERDPTLPIRGAPIDQNYNHQGNPPSHSNIGETIPAFGPPVLLSLEHNILQDELRNNDGVLDSGDPLEFAQSDLGWGFDFSTMDLETFFSIYPTMDQVTS